MTSMMHYAVGLLWLLAGTGIFTHSINNSAGFGQAFIPSGGRVGAARLIRHLAPAWV